MRLLLAILFCFPASGIVRQQCGGPGGLDPQGNVWQPDAPFATKPQWNTAGSLPIPYNHLRFSDPPSSSFSYSFPISAGQYSVTLFFIEPNKTAPGQRVFSVAINGAPVLTNLDLFASAGLLRPKEFTFPVTTSAGVLTIAFLSTNGNAVVSGIEIGDAVPPSIGPSYRKGFLSEKPPCPGPVDFYHATDGRTLFWCDGIAWEQLNFPAATRWTVEYPPAEARECYSYPRLDAAGLFVGWESRCTPIARSLVDQAPGLFDSATGLFDAHQ